MTKDEIIKMASEAGINVSLYDMGAASCVFSEGCHGVARTDFEHFAIACYEAGKAEFSKGAKVTIPPHAMEQEFQLHYRKGYEAGRTAEREEAAKVVEAIEARCIAKDVDDPPLAHVAQAIRARGKP